MSQITNNVLKRKDTNTGTDGNQNDIHLESMSNGDDTEGHGNIQFDEKSQHGVVKESKDQRATDMNFMMTNPFKQNGKKSIFIN